MPNSKHILISTAKILNVLHVVVIWKRKQYYSFKWTESFIKRGNSSHAKKRGPHGHCQQPRVFEKCSYEGNLFGLPQFIKLTFLLINLSVFNHQGTGRAWTAHHSPHDHSQVDSRGAWRISPVCARQSAGKFQMAVAVVILAWSSTWCDLSHFKCDLYSL